jgi:hypothetical protein
VNPSQPRAPRHCEPKLLYRLASAIRTRQMSRRTEQAYRQWVRRFILNHGKWLPAEMAESEIKLSPHPPGGRVQGERLESALDTVAIAPLDSAKS